MRVVRLDSTYTHRTSSSSSSSRRRVSKRKRERGFKVLPQHTQLHSVYTHHTPQCSGRTHGMRQTSFLLSPLYHYLRHHMQRQQRGVVIAKWPLLCAHFFPLSVSVVVCAQVTRSQFRQCSLFALMFGAHTHTYCMCEGK